MRKDQEYHIHTGDDNAWTVWQARYGVAWKVICHCPDKQTAKSIADALGAGKAASVIIGPDGIAHPFTEPPAADEPSATMRLDASWDAQIEADAHSGRLDALADKALADHQAGSTTPLFAAGEAPAMPVAALWVAARKGDDFLAEGADHYTYGISVQKPDGNWWGNQIEIYGNEKLRDTILAALTAAVAKVTR